MNREITPYKDLKIERNPEAIGKLKKSHIRVLQRMLNHKLGMYARFPERATVNGFLKSEIGSLAVAIAELNELLESRKSDGD